MQFARLIEYFSTLDTTSSRNSMTEQLVMLLQELETDEVRKALYLTLGQMGPLYSKKEFNLSEKMIVRGLALLYEVEGNSVWKLFKKVGDLGKVAEEMQMQTGMTKVKPSGLEVGEVYNALLLIAQENGQGSQERKLRGLVQLLKVLNGEEQKYVVRIILGRLRLGFSDKTILDALSVMVSGTKQSRAAIEQVYQIHPDVGLIAAVIKEGGLKKLPKAVVIQLGVPIVPALCQRLKTAEEMIVKMGKVIIEPKFDGTRVQIHARRQETGDRRQAWKVRTFTRNLEETSWMFPELATGLEQVKAKEIILDSEAVGIDPKTGTMLPFQETMTRKRKHEIEATMKLVPLRFNVFDVLYKDGEVLVGKSLLERKKILEKTIIPGKTLKVVETIQTSDAGVLRDFHKESLRKGFEGVVVKQEKSVYEPGRRGWSWVKFKEAEESAAKLSDTIDAVVMGFYRGKGKRTQFGIGAFLVGVLADEIADGLARGPRQVLEDDTAGVKSLPALSIVTLAKIGTGLSDEQWRELRKRLEENVAIEKPKEYAVHKSLVPDVWVDPKVVVEIAADEITQSPIHSAGVALRFPRLVRFRDDKSLDTATTLAEVKTIGMG